LILSGIVVNNSIVLIDSINQKMKKSSNVMLSIYLASTSRLRPILMTSFTTIFGILPMCLPQIASDKMWQSMAVTISGGLLFSTFITLFLIPVIYSIFNDIKKKFCDLMKIC
jgi:HAE1 family hydrophobic/amphiphilic exporter-1